MRLSKKVDIMGSKFLIEVLLDKDVDSHRVTINHLGHANFNKLREVKSILIPETIASFLEDADVWVKSSFHLIPESKAALDVLLKDGFEVA